MKITEELTHLIANYKNTSITAENLNDLMNLRKQISCKGYELGVEVARNKRSLEKAIYERKTNFYKFKKDYLGDGVTKAETLAESEIVEYRKNEQVHQGIYDFGKIILHQVNEVLSSLQQDISQLKAEYHASL